MAALPFLPLAQSVPALSDSEVHKLIVTCQKCGAILDDEHQTTVCPHQPLGHLGQTLCRKHDLFDCAICASESTARNAAGLDVSPEPEPAPCVFEEGKRVWWHSVILDKIRTGICLCWPAVKPDSDPHVSITWTGDKVKMRDTPEQALADARAWQKAEVQRIAAIVFELPVVEG